ncbi:MAG: exodeoxyribonuclease VII small subunit [Nocardioides sp.]
MPPKKTEPAADVTAETPSYEAAREELIEVVRALETGGTTLEESLALWERGERLATICQDWLDGARERLDAAVEADEPDS